MNDRKYKSQLTPSRTMVINILIALIGSLTALSTDGLNIEGNEAEWIVTATACLNIILRKLTGHPIEAMIFRRKK